MYTKEEKWGMEEVRKSESKFKYLSKEFKANKHIAYAAVNKYPDNLEFVSTELKKDLSFVKNVVRTKGSCLRYASSELKNNKELVLIAIRGFWSSSIQYASDELKKDKEIALKAIEGDASNFVHIHESIKDDPEIIKATLSKNPRMFKSLTTLSKNNLEYLNFAYTVDENEKEAIFSMGLEIKENPESFLKGRYLNVVNYCLETDVIQSWNSHNLLGTLEKSLLKNNDKIFFDALKNEIFDFLNSKVEYQNLRHLPSQVVNVLNHAFKAWDENEIKDAILVSQKHNPKSAYPENYLVSGMQKLLHQEESRKAIISTTLKTTVKHGKKKTRKLKLG
jgi:hypothetical protein